ncbi:Homeobox expressed in ES cell 1-B [Thelohanellus kitauei]|uniref:Homeobox expressed in ES cell 1-B n=1 Tax=Thelohanellus kitauei TaxID=669202 RepID=A0A0C2MYJ8_THEKT|nr:Homeobox expressed in ES cell 1-B [Thelohanellus kitauei]
MKDNGESSLVQNNTGNEMNLLIQARQVQKSPQETVHPNKTRRIVSPIYSSIKGPIHQKIQTINTPGFQITLGLYQKPSKGFTQETVNPCHMAQSHAEEDLTKNSSCNNVSNYQVTLESTTPQPGPNYNLLKNLQTRADSQEVSKCEHCPQITPTTQIPCVNEGVTRSRRKRTHFSKYQLDILENEFSKNHKVSLGKREELASKLMVTENHVTVWFQNRRQKFNKEHQKHKEVKKFHRDKE